MPGMIDFAIADTSYKGVCHAPRMVEHREGQLCAGTLPATDKKGTADHTHLQ
jgi:hypothetical protein